jgi:hypothetical protein
LAAVMVPKLLASAETLPVKRVILSSSGLAQIDRAGAVDGNAEINLPAPVDQVDDILKSLTVFDGTGRVDSVRLAGKEPLAQEFRSLPFGLPDLNAPETLLAALRGAEISVLGPRVIQGRIVSVEPFTEKIGEDGSLTHHRLTILGKDGLESVTLEETQKIAFIDPVMQSKLDRALAVSLDSRAKDERSIDIKLAGKGSRPVSLSYVVTAPIWKTSYRLMLPKAGDKAPLQGWAVLENMTGSDWDKIDLAIVSGNPVTFHQALYESYYVNRPDIPVQVYGRVTPREDQGETGMIASYASAPAAAAMGKAARGMLHSDALEEIMVTAGKATAAGQQAVESAETGAQISFRFPQPVSVAAGQSLMVPFIGKDLPIERVWLYQPDANPIHPLAAIRIVNDTDSGLPAGILTVYEGERDEYAGDAEFPNLPRADSRLVSYALDQKTLIDREETSDQTLSSITGERGIIHVTRRTVSDTAYTIKAPADGSRTIIIEQAKRQDFEPEDGKGLEMTPTHYRLKTVVGAGETKLVHLRLVHPFQEEIGITNLDDSALEIWLASARALNNRAAIDALSEIAKRRRAVADAQSKIEDMDAHVERIHKDQDRLRLNLAQVPKDSDLAKRYLETLTTQETELSGLSRDRATAEQNRVVAETKLADGIAMVKF